MSEDGSSRCIWKLAVISAKQCFYFGNLRHGAESERSTLIGSLHARCKTPARKHLLSAGACALEEGTAHGNSPLANV